MKVISLWQPWATLMAAGFKRIETRSWAPRGLHRGQLVAIHAAKRWSDYERELCQYDRVFMSALANATERGLWNLVSPPLGCVVAIARFELAIPTFQLFNGDAPTGLVTMSDAEETFGNYGPNRYGWVFSAVRPLQPIPLRGQQGIFEWTPPAELVYLEPRNEAKELVSP